MTIPSSGPVTFTDIQTEFGGTNPIALNEYYAGGGLVPAGTSGTYGAVPTSGQISVQNFYGTSDFVPVYIEDVFSTWLYTGNSSTQTITNGIDLSGSGGLVWTKCRSTATDHALVDTVRGADKVLHSESTAAQVTYADITSFNSTGYSLSSVSGWFNTSSRTYASWTFEKAPKFFDIVTFTKDTSGNQRIPHNLGSVPGCIIVKTINSANDWYVYHQSLTGGGAANKNFLTLNSTNAVVTKSSGNYWGDPPTSTDFGVSNELLYDGGSEASRAYIGYVFASNAGGFGATGTDNVISCGSYTGDGGAGTTAITLGYEPQWILVKATSGSDNWGIFDNMRGLCVDNNASNDARLIPNASNAEGLIGAFEPTATGFKTTLFTNYNASGETYIYVAIRRGPMKVPTVGTSVFAPTLITATQSTQNVTSVGFSPDLIINGVRSNANYGQQVTDRLRGVTKQVFTEYNSSEGTTNGTALVSLDMTGFTLGSDTAGTGWNAYSGYTSVKWSFKRAPSYFDEVCYTGTGAGSGNAKSHNLGVVPELMIVKRRSASDYWMVYSSFTGKDASLYLNVADAAFGSGGGFWGNGSTTISPTASVFYVGDRTELNSIGSTYVAYLFATCAGVSKVGNYTGNGSTQTINCGFGAGGARFVLIKRTDSTGDWYTYDTARGMTTLTDPYLLLNSASAEVATLGSVTTVSTGFALNSTILAAINVNGGTYIFLAIA